MSTQRGKNMEERGTTGEQRVNKIHKQIAVCKRVRPEARSWAWENTWVGRRVARGTQPSSPGWSWPMCSQSWRAWCSSRDAALPAVLSTRAGAGSSWALAWNSRNSKTGTEAAMNCYLAPKAGPALPSCCPFDFCSPSLLSTSGMSSLLAWKGF